MQLRCMVIAYNSGFFIQQYTKLSETTFKRNLLKKKTELTICKCSWESLLLSKNSQKIRG